MKLFVVFHTYIRVCNHPKSENGFVLRPHLLFNFHLRRPVITVLVSSTYQPPNRTVAKIKYSYF